MTSANRALAALRQMIFDGELPAGSDHLEIELADRLGMSRTPVREALRALESQGLAELRPRRGIRVLPISAADMREIYDILTELESHAAARAAGRTDADLAPLDRALVRMDHALAAKDLEAWAAADDDFHQTLVALAGNARLVSMVALLRDQVRRARRVTLHMRPWPEQSNSDHRALVAAIREGQADLAHDLHHAHCTRARQMLLALLERHQLRQI